MAVTVTRRVNRGGGRTENVSVWVATTKVSTVGARQTLSSGAKSRGFILGWNVYLRAVLVKVDKVQAFVQIRIWEVHLAWNIPKTFVMWSCDDKGAGGQWRREGLTLECKQQKSNYYFLGLRIRCVANGTPAMAGRKWESGPFVKYCAWPWAIIDNFRSSGKQRSARLSLIRPH